MNDTTRSLPLTRRVLALPALPGTTEPYLLELELQVARSYSSYCLLHADLLALKSMEYNPAVSCGFTETQAAQQSPTDPTRGEGK